MGQGTGNREQGTGATPRGQVLRHGDRCYATGTGATPRGQVISLLPRADVHAWGKEGRKLTYLASLQPVLA